MSPIDWNEVENELDRHGCVLLSKLLDDEECETLCRTWSEPGAFRSEVVMARHGFGSGAYRYYDYPLPPLVARLRTELYRPLAAIANRWADALGSAQRFPAEHGDYLKRCHATGQTRPTPLLLRYEAGGWNALHQ